MRGTRIREGSGTSFLRAKKKRTSLRVAPLSASVSTRPFLSMRARRGNIEGMSPRVRETTRAACTPDKPNTFRGERTIARARNDEARPKRYRLACAASPKKQIRSKRRRDCSIPSLYTRPSQISLPLRLVKRTASAKIAPQRIRPASTFRSARQGRLPRTKAAMIRKSRQKSGRIKRNSCASRSVRIVTL